MKLRILVMLVAAFAFAGTVGTVRLNAQNDHDHPTHDSSDHASHDASDHGGKNHESSGRDVNTHDISPHDSPQDTMDRNMQNAKEVSERQAKEKDAEEMRSKEHDGRVKVSDHTSVGGKIEPGGGSVNVKTDTDRHGPPDHPK